MSYLTTDINESTQLLPVAAPLSNPTYPIFYRLASETVKVVRGAETTEWEVERGASDTIATSHGRGTALILDTTPFGDAASHTHNYLEPD